MPTVNVTSSVWYQSTTHTMNNISVTGDETPTEQLSPLEVGLTAVGAILVIMAAIACIYFYRTKRWFRSFEFWKRPRRRRLSSGSSHRPLDEEGTSIDIPGSRREPNLFSIDDEDGDGTRDDGYFYDEVFEKSAFVDAQTNAALKELYTTNDDELPELNFKEELRY